MHAKNIRYVIGVDEVGRGPLAGPVTVCACLIPVGDRGTGGFDKKSKSVVRDLAKGSRFKASRLTDSKGMKERDREAWDALIRAHAGISFEIRSAPASDIDNKGISACIRSLVRSCLFSILRKQGIDPAECLVLLDGGLKAPEEFVFQETHVKGDTLFPAISFASILAKVSRDSYMRKISSRSSEYQAYGFASHKGYGTVAHRAAIARSGLSDQHRRSFCKNAIAAKKEGRHMRASS